MAPITAEDIREKMLAGKTSEARILLTMAGASLGGTDQAELEQELTRLQREVEGLLVRAEALERENRIDEAREVYESAGRLASDSPGIQIHLKRIDEALLLARAIKKRGQRLRQAVTEAPAAPPKKKTALFSAGLVAGLVVLLAGITLLRDKPPTSTKADDAPVTTQDRPVPAPTLPKAKEQPPPLPQTKPPLPAQQPADVQTLTPTDSESAVAASAPERPLPASVPEPAATPPLDTDRLPQLYTVRVGDSLSLIADRELCRQALWQAIFRLNRDRIADPSKLQPGMELTLEGLENHCRQDR